MYPQKKCINDCKFCCSKMHTADYTDRFTDINYYSDFSGDMRKRLIYARENNCNTCMLTGNNEPQQNKEFLRVFSEVNRSLSNPFLNIEMQTSGAYIDQSFLDFFKHSVGLTTIAISVACLDDDAANRDMIQTKDSALCLEALCREIKKRNINLRICLNMNDSILIHNCGFNWHKKYLLFFAKIPFIIFDLLMLIM
ncbi:MAG: radical SAM protein [Clostridia bacterium]|nr:radical SAM protein [Clostridia bacterium]